MLREKLEQIQESALKVDSWSPVRVMTMIPKGSCIFKPKVQIYLTLLHKSQFHVDEFECEKSKKKNSVKSLDSSVLYNTTSSVNIWGHFCNVFETFQPWECRSQGMRGCRKLLCLDLWEDSSRRKVSYSTLVSKCAASASVENSSVDRDCIYIAKMIWFWCVVSWRASNWEMEIVREAMCI